MPIPLGSGLDAQGTARITNLPNAVSNQEPATLGQLNSGIASIGATSFSNADFFLGNNDWTSVLHSVSVGTLVYNATEQGMVANGVSSTVTVRCRLPVDPDTFYHVRVKLKKVSGTGTIYIGAKSLDNTFNNLATDTQGSFNYFVASNVTLAAGNTGVYQGTIGGYNPVSPGASVVNKFDPEAKYWDLVIITNYNGSGETAIQSIEIKKARFYQRIDDTLDIYGVGDIRGALRFLTGGNFTLPSAGGSAVIMTGADGTSSNSGRIILGDGSGWNLRIVSRTGNTDTLRFTLTDAGAFTATGTVTANAFSGSGASLTALNGSNILTGTIADARLSAQVVLKNVAAVMTAKFSTLASAAGGAGFNLPHGAAPTTPTDGDMWTTTAGLFARINGSNWTIPNQLAANIWGGKQTFQTPGAAAASITLPHGTAPTTPTNGDFWSTTGGLFFQLSGATRTLLLDNSSLAAANLTGTIADARLSSNVPLKNTSNTFTDDQIVSGAAADKRLIARGSGAVAGQGGLQIDQGSTYGFHAYASSTGGASGFLDFVYKNIGTNTAQNGTATYRFNGPLTATSFGGDGASVTNLNASNLASGTVPDARFPATLPAASGVNLTNLNANNLASGTVPDARLAATVGRTNVDQTYTGKITTLASSATKAGLNIPHGAAPTTPVNGDVWTTTTDALVRINSVTRTFLLDNSALNATNMTTGTLPLARLSNIADAQIAAAAAIAWTKISKTGSSLADLTTRSAGDLNSGTLANARTTGTSSPTADTLALRDAAGRMQAANPSAAQDVATKSYVDSATGGGATGSDAILYSIFGF